MISLLQVFIDIALWRKGPQDLPASRALLWLIASVYALISVVELLVLGKEFSSALVLVVIDMALTVLWLWGLLTLFSKSARLLQIATAVFGIETLLAIVVIAARLLTMGTMPELPTAMDLLNLSLYLVLVGRMLALAIDGSLFTGVPLALAIAVSTAVIAQVIVPGAYR
jgi:hypothetical protein